jgi:hypothetical protein
MSKRLFWLISFVSVLALVASAQAEVIFSDNFDHAMTDDWSRINYQGWYEENVLVPLGYPATYPGGPWTIGAWDGYQSMPGEDGISPTALAYNFVDTFNAGMGEANSVPAWTPGTEGEVANGVLTITSANSGWSDAWNTGPFLFKKVTGDFVARVQVVGQDHFWNNLGGLMARAPGDGLVETDGKSSEVGSTGANENWVYLTYFPVYNVGNHIRNTVNGASAEKGIKHYPCDPYLELSRVGNTFFFKTSPDGVSYASLPDLEAGIVRDDLPAELQVGIFAANYTGDWQATMDFDNFVIETVPVQPAQCPAKKVIYVTSVKDNNKDGVQDDLSWVDWLTAEGYDVDCRPDYWKDPLDANEIAELNAADLVIASRGMATGDYDGAETPKWNGVTAPMICTNAWQIRTSRWKWLNNNTANKDAGAPLMLVSDPCHPIFAGLPVDADGMLDILDPNAGSGHTSFNTDFIDPGNGTLLSISLGKYTTAWIVEW